jgi:hypothetical protein
MIRPRALKDAVVSVQEIPILDGAPTSSDTPAVVELVEAPAVVSVQPVFEGPAPVPAYVPAPYISDAVWKSKFRRSP